MWHEIFAGFNFTDFMGFPVIMKIRSWKLAPAKKKPSLKILSIWLDKWILIITSYWYFVFCLSQMEYKIMPYHSHWIVMVASWHKFRKCTKKLKTALYFHVSKHCTCKTKTRKNLFPALKSEIIIFVKICGGEMHKICNPQNWTLGKIWCHTCPVGIVSI